MATHSSIRAWKILWTEEPGGYSPQGHRESDTTEVTQHAHMYACPKSKETLWLKILEFLINKNIYYKHKNSVIWKKCLNYPVLEKSYIQFYKDFLCELFLNSLTNIVQILAESVFYVYKYTSLNSKMNLVLSYFTLKKSLKYHKLIFFC